MAPGFLRPGQGAPLITVARRLQPCSLPNRFEVDANLQSFWSGSVGALTATPLDAITGALVQAQMRHYRSSQAQQLRAWEDSIALLRTALQPYPDWHVMLQYPMLRLGRRADAIVLTSAAILVLEFKVGAQTCDPAAREQAEDYALDLRDFHAGCRTHPIIPILVATHASPRQTALPLLLDCVAPVIDASAATLAATVQAIARATTAPRTPLDQEAWMAAPYRPVPTIIEAACMLYARHGAAEIAAARADSTNLTCTTGAILAALAQARAEDAKIALFVTGIPGAGKTLCGLNTCFGEARATFLTGNPSLVHVLREALARDAIGQGQNRRNARQQMEGAIQALPRFRDHHLSTGETPAERAVVVDEAQRCWSRAHALAKSRDRPVRLTDSEPALLLDIMSRQQGFAAMVCLVGSGQEIHNGEGGLAEWGAALRARPGWRVRAPPDLLDAADPRQRLGALPNLTILPDLHLAVPVRQVRSTAASAWVDHVLAGREQAARQLGPVPFLLTRSLPALRAWLRAAARGSRRCGLLASAGARRLRAAGLGAELPHMDPNAVARWFLDRWPDVRASDALEVVATEFSAQGLELDHAGLCWDGDLVREPGRAAWRVRAFRGTRWTTPAGAEAIANQVNTYRVLLTRARYETVIFVPEGDPADRTRDPAVLDGVARYLAACGACTLSDVKPEATPAARELLL